MGKLHADRGILDSILRFSHARKPALLRLKLRRMKHDPFTFFRGADHLYGLDWPVIKPIDPGPSILICGDLHLENFGAHRTTAGDYCYDVNDFDEAVIAPSGFDLVRCAASIILASEQWKLRPSQSTGMVLAYLENYRNTMLAEVETDPVHESSPHGGHGPIQKLLGSIAIATQAELLRSTIRREANGKPVIRKSKTLLSLSRKRFEKVCDALETYGERKGKIEAFKVHDVVFRIAGVGSLGVRRYVALLEGSGPPDGLPSSGRQGPYRIREMIPAENRSSLNRFQQQPAWLANRAFADFQEPAIHAAGEVTSCLNTIDGSRSRPEVV